jgi:hypothetical protein
MFSAANYSTNCTTFDPKGKILQIDYAKEAVKQGSTSLGLKSNTHVVSYRVREGLPFAVKGRLNQVCYRFWLALRGLLTIWQSIKKRFSISMSTWEL